MQISSHPMASSDLQDFQSSLDKSKVFEMACSVNSVIFGFDGDMIQVLLIRRNQEPYKNRIALPGGLISKDDTPERYSDDMIIGLTGVKEPYKKHIRAFSDPFRHPTGRVISIGFYALVRIADVNLTPFDEMDSPEWYCIDDLPELPFDHDQIIRSAFRRMRSRYRRKPIAIELLNDPFTLGEFQHLTETVLGEKMDKRNFHRKVKSTGLLEMKEEKRKIKARRPANLYTANKSRYLEMRVSSKSFL